MADDDDNALPAPPHAAPAELAVGHAAYRKSAPATPMGGALDLQLFPSALVQDVARMGASVTSTTATPTPAATRGGSKMPRANWGNLVFHKATGAEAGDVEIYIPKV